MRAWLTWRAVLLQRALRINSDSQRLWLEYFRLELLYIAKVNARRMVLELDVDDEKVRASPSAPPRPAPPRRRSLARCIQRQRELEVPQLPEEGEEEGEATAAGSQRATSRAAAARAAAEARAAASSAELSQLQRKQAFLRGAVPLVIYVNAIKGAPPALAARAHAAFAHAAPPRAQPSPKTWTFACSLWTSATCSWM